MKGVDEVHLLNITVAPALQRQGWAPLMLEALDGWSRAQGAQWLWLEVRASNERASPSTSATASAASACARATTRPSTTRAKTPWS